MVVGARRTVLNILKIVMLISWDCHLQIHSAYHVVAALCIKSCRCRSGTLGNAYVEHQNRKKIHSWLRDVVYHMEVGSRRTDLNISKIKKLISQDFHTQLFTWKTSRKQQFYRAEMSCWWKRSVENDQIGLNWQEGYSNTNNNSVRLYWAEKADEQQQKTAPAFIFVIQEQTSEARVSTGSLKQDSWEWKKCSVSIIQLYPVFSLILESLVKNYLEDFLHGTWISYNTDTSTSHTYTHCTDDSEQSFKIFWMIPFFLYKLSYILIKRGMTVLWAGICRMS